MFDKMKQVYDMQKKAKDLQGQLLGLKVKKGNRDGSLSVTMNGTQRVEDIVIGNEWLSPAKRDILQKGLTGLLNDALTDIQKQTAAQAQELMKEFKGLGLPGM